MTYQTYRDTLGDIETGCTNYDTQYDIHQVGATCDDSYLYFLWEIEGSVGQPPDSNFVFWVYLDADDNSETGGQLGAEYLVHFAMQAGSVRADWSGLFDAAVGGWPPPQLYSLTADDYCIWGTYLEVRVPKSYMQLYGTDIKVWMGVDVNFFGPGGQCMDQTESFHIPAACGAATTVTIDEAYTADYGGNPKSAFNDCEYMTVGFKATNHTTETLIVTFNEQTYGPSGLQVPELSPGEWQDEMGPGQHDYPLLQFIPDGAETGTYTYTVSAAHGAQTHRRDTTFTVSESEEAITFVDAVTTRGIDEYNWHTGEVTAFAANERIYVWTLWEHALGYHTARFKWYKPDSAVFSDLADPYNNTQFCGLAWWHSIEGAPNLDTGTWRVEVYMDGELKTSLNFDVVAARQTGAM